MPYRMAIPLISRPLIAQWRVSKIVHEAVVHDMAGTRIVSTQYGSSTSDGLHDLLKSMMISGLCLTKRHFSNACVY